MSVPKAAYIDASVVQNSLRFGWPMSPNSASFFKPLFPNTLTPQDRQTDIKRFSSGICTVCTPWCCSLELSCTSCLVFCNPNLNVVENYYLQWSAKKSAVTGIWSCTVLKCVMVIIHEKLKLSFQEFILEFFLDMGSFSLLCWQWLLEIIILLVWY